MRITSGATALALPAARLLRWHVAPGGVVRLTKAVPVSRHVLAVRRARCRLHTGACGACVRVCDVGGATKTASSAC